MAKEITKAYILQQIQDKFKLRDFETAPFLFNETVIPTYDIEKHLQTWKTRFSEKSVTSGPGTILFYTVPDTQRWHLRTYNVVFMAAGAYTVTGLYIQRKTSAAGYSVYLDMIAGQTVSYAKLLTMPYQLEAGDEIYLYIDSYTSTANLRLYIDYIMEEIR